MLVCDEASISQVRCSKSGEKERKWERKPEAYGKQRGEASLCALRVRGTVGFKG